MSLYDDDLSMFRRAALRWRYPQRPVFLDPNTRDPRAVMEELRAEDPDAHALLSEHLVLPESNTGTDPK